MNNRSKSFDLTTNDPKKVIEVNVRYSKPDGSYHDSRAEEQGYYGSVVPVEVDGMFRTTTAFSGVKWFIEPAKRFGAKKLEAIHDRIRHEALTGHTEHSIVQTILQVAETNGLAVTQWSK